MLWLGGGCCLNSFKFWTISLFAGQRRQGQTGDPFSQWPLNCTPVTKNWLRNLWLLLHHHMQHHDHNHLCRHHLIYCTFKLYLFSSACHFLFVLVVALWNHTKHFPSRIKKVLGVLHLAVVPPSLKFSPNKSHSLLFLDRLIWEYDAHLTDTGKRNDASQTTRQLGLLGARCHMSVRRQWNREDTGLAGRWRRLPSCQIVALN